MFSCIDNKNGYDIIKTYKENKIMARHPQVFPPQTIGELNVFRFQPESKLTAERGKLQKVLSHLKLTDHALYQDCISGYAVWETNDHDHYPTFYTNAKLYLETGSNSRIMIIDSNYAYSGDLKLYPTDSGPAIPQGGYYGADGIAIDIYGVRTVLPLSANLADVHTAVMLCDYAIGKLREMKPEEAKNSPLLKLKQGLENDLKAMKKGTQTTLKTPIFEYISEGTFAEAQERAELRAKILSMINGKLIPPETKDKKYPLDVQKLNQILPKIQQKYQLRLAKLERKAMIKSQREDIKRARIEKRQKLKDERQRKKDEKAKQKKELEELKQSMSEAQL